MTFISFVVDKLELHYYQAELLLYSITKNTHYKKSNIIVQCLNRVDQYFLDYLTNNGYNYIIIEPYLDGKYCNKLQQLEYFKDKSHNVILLDTDMFVLSAFDIPDKNYICGKVVDAPNPPLSILKHIFKEALIEIPSITFSDWDIPNNQTFSCNFNGGFYYIPNKYVNEISSEWRKWATWLYERSELFETPQQFIHTDQISMAMAIASTGSAYRNLNANANYPIHVNCELTSFQNSKDVSILHYHRGLSQFGLLNTGYSSNENIKYSIEKANNDIVAMEKSVFYEKYRRTLIEEPKKPKNYEEIKHKLEKLSSLSSKRLKLILHSGTPKTGTTSLQFFMDNNRENLLEQGILYAPKDKVSFAPKHQWIVSTLINNNFLLFLDELEKTLACINNDTHTIILSTEGIYNHWWDYSLEAKYFLQHLTHYFDVDIWVWFREPVSFSESLYRQYLKNPRVEGIFCYGRDLSLNDMIEDKWFIAHLDYVGFLQEAEALFGINNVYALPMKGDIIETACNVLNVRLDHRNVLRQNEKLDCTMIKVLRIFNRYEIPFQEKEKLVNSLYEIEMNFGDYLEDKKICNGDISKIQALCKLQHQYLETVHNLSF